MLSEDELDDLIADNNFQHGRDYERGHPKGAKQPIHLGKATTPNPVAQHPVAAADLINISECAGLTAMRARTPSDPTIGRTLTSDESFACSAPTAWAR